MHTINKAVKFTYIFNLYLQKKTAVQYLLMSLQLTPNLGVRVISVRANNSYSSN